MLGRFVLGTKPVSCHYDGQAAGFSVAFNIQDGVNALIKLLLEIEWPFPKMSNYSFYFMVMSSGSELCACLSWLGKKTVTLVFQGLTAETYFLYRLDSRLPQWELQR